MKDSNDKRKCLGSVTIYIDDSNIPWAENNDKEIKEFDLEELSELLRIDIIEKLINGT